MSVPQRRVIGRGKGRVLGVDHEHRQLRSTVLAQALRFRVFKSNRRINHAQDIVLSARTVHLYEIPHQGYGHFVACPDIVLAN